VLSNSWGGEGSSQLLTDAFAYAQSQGCVAIAAAGNDEADARGFFPANIDSVIAVAASTQKDEKCSFSNYGPKIDVSAPGGGYDNELGGRRNILSTMPDDSALGRNRDNSQFKVSSGYWRLSGTSMACPHVAGVAALIISQHPHLTNEEVRQIIQGSADDIGETGKDDYFGYGRINAYKAVNTYSYISSSTRFMHARQEIMGSASLIEGFQRYELYYTPKNNPQNIILINSSTTPVNDGLLGVWDTNGLSDGEYLLTLKVIDRNNKESKLTRDVTIDNISQPPVFKNLSDKLAVVGRPFEFKVEASDPDDPDTPEGRLEYSATNLPPTAQFDPKTQILSWQPTNSDKGTYQVTFTVRDNEHTVNQDIALSTMYIEETQIITDAKDQEYPAIYADKIVWDDNRNGNWDIYMYDLSTLKETQITTNAKNQASHAIYGDKIVWEDYRNGNCDIYMYDLSTHQETQITTDAKDQWYPDIYADKIVWMDNRNGHPDIYMYDLSKHQEIQITTDAKEQYFPAIYADKIVYEDERNGNSDIYMYDLSTHQETQITTDAADQCYPAIYADKIVWDDYRNGNWDIYMYDLSKHQEIQITTDAQNQWGSAIYADKIVWTDNRNRNSDIYMARIFFVPQIINLSFVTTSPGSLITINGNNFGYAQRDGSRVEFANGTAVPVESWSNSQITCRVPAEAASGPLKVVTLGGRSNGIEITVSTSPVPPAMPTNLTATAISATQVKLDWQDNSDNETNFRVWRISSSDLKLVLVATRPSNTTTYIDTGLTPGVTYYYGVCAYSQGDVFQSCSNAVEASIPIGPRY